MQENLQLLHADALLLSEESSLLHSCRQRGECAGALGRAAAVTGQVADLPSQAGACLGWTEHLGILVGKARQVCRECVQRRATKMMKGLENKSCEE